MLIAMLPVLALPPGHARIRLYVRGHVVYDLKRSALETQCPPQTASCASLLRLREGGGTDRRTPTRRQELAAQPPDRDDRNDRG